MKIINLHAENFKRLEAVDITPDSEIVVLAGANEQGKSSVLDAIMAALCGGKGMRDIPEPIKRGEDHAEVTLDLGDMKIKRVWERGGKNRIEVTNAEGAKFTSPQAILDALTGALTFDPLEFARMAPRYQRATLIKLIELPFDIEEHDALRQELLTVKTEASRKVKQHTDKARFIVPDDTPDEETPAAELIQEMQRLREIKEANDRERALLEKTERDYSLRKSAVRDSKEHVAKFERAVEEAKENLEEAKEHLDACCNELARVQKSTEKQQNAVSALVDPDTSEVDAKLASLDETNRNVRMKRANAEARQALKDACEAETAAREAILAHDKARAEALEAAAFPVDGLGFSDEGVTLHGLSFSQASESQRITTSAAMGIAMNPRLRVMMIRDGSALDSKRMEMLAELARKHDFQLWIEKVDETGSVGIVIEDGRVKAA